MKLVPRVPFQCVVNMLDRSVDESTHRYIIMSLVTCLLFCSSCQLQLPIVHFLKAPDSSTGAKASGIAS